MSMKERMKAAWAGFSFSCSGIIGLFSVYFAVYGSGMIALFAIVIATLSFANIYTILVSGKNLRKSRYFDIGFFAIFACVAVVWIIGIIALSMRF